MRHGKRAAAEAFSRSAFKAGLIALSPSEKDAEFLRFARFAEQLIVEHEWRELRWWATRWIETFPKPLRVDDACPEVIETALDLIIVVEQRTEKSVRAARAAASEWKAHLAVDGPFDTKEEAIAVARLYPLELGVPAAQNMIRIEAYPESIGMRFVGEIADRYVACDPSRPVEVLGR